MTFSFRDVTVNEVEIYERDHKHSYDGKSDRIPGDISRFLGANLQMIDNTGRDIGVMIDPLPTMAIYTQVFCDNLVLKKEDDLLMSGTPCKASVRNLNMQRIINQPSIVGASGTFYSTIELQKEEEGNSEIIRFFQKRGCPGKKLRGVFIRYNLHRVFEEELPDYEKIVYGSNPAYATVTGTFSPWYDGEMRSMSMARLLLPAKPYLPGKRLQHVLCMVNPDHQTVSLDLIGSIPEINESVKNSPEVIPPYPHEYSTVDIGEIKLQLVDEDNNVHDIGSFNLDDKEFGDRKPTKIARIIDFSYAGNLQLSNHRFQNGFFRLAGTAGKSTEDEGLAVTFSKESQYVFGSDEAGVYSNQFDKVSDGYRSYSKKKEACRIRIFSRGKPVTEPIAVSVFEYKVTGDVPEFSLSNILAHQNGKIKDGDHLLFPLDKACNTIYYFMEEKLPAFTASLLSDFSRTGFFISHRVLLKHDYKKYTDPNHADYESEIPYELIMAEIFNVYDLIYPVSSEISPYNHEAIQRAIPVLMRLMSPGNWASSTYMPSTREMSDDQFELLSLWAEQQRKNKTWR